MKLTAIADNVIVKVTDLKPDTEGLDEEAATELNIKFGMATVSTAEVLFVGGDVDNITKGDKVILSRNALFPFQDVEGTMPDVFAVKAQFIHAIVDETKIREGAYCKNIATSGI